MSTAVSVVIPTYNAAAFIAETIDAVLCQTQQPAEVIVVDDASRDETCALVEQLALSSPIPLRLIRLPSNTGGPATPLNVGIEHAHSPLIALLDHDDLLLPDKFALQVEAFRVTPDLVLAFGDYTLFGTSGETAGMHEWVKDYLRGKSVFRDGRYVVPPAVMTKIQLLDCGAVQSCSNLMFPRRLWVTGNHFDPRHNIIADYLFKLRLAAEGPAVFFPQVLFRKRCHGKNLYSGANLSTVRAIFDAMLSTILAQTNLLTDSDFRRRVRHMFVYQGWRHREQGQPLHALRYYWNGLRCAGFSPELVYHFAVFPLAIISRFINRGLTRSLSGSP
jgi:glycosyltransferase involved in cell wall biosynthesis